MGRAGAPDLRNIRPQIEHYNRSYVPSKGSVSHHAVPQIDVTTFLLLVPFSVLQHSNCHESFQFQSPYGPSKPREVTVFKDVAYTRAVKDLKVTLQI